MRIEWAPNLAMVRTSVVAPGISAHPLAPALVDDGGVHAGEQRDPGIERGFEIQFAAHRRLGDGGDLLLEAGVIGELVDALALDHRRIHVGDDQRLAARGRGGLHDDVEVRQRGFKRSARVFGEAGGVKVERIAGIDPSGC